MRQRAIALVVAPMLMLGFGLGGSGSALASGSNSSSSPSVAVADDNSYAVTRLVSDMAGRAAQQDPNLVNAWGLVAGPSTPWWVADNGMDVSTLYGGDGTILPLVVGVADGPTGTVFNGGPNFVISDGTNSGSAMFLFATEGGTIRGWNPGVPPPSPSTQTFVAADRSGVGAVYKGLAIASGEHGDLLYATDFHNGRVDVFDGSFHLVTPHGAFVDPALPQGYAPFGIRNLGGHLLVTYAKQDADAHDDSPGPGHGFIDMFNTRGAFLARVASRGPLDSPWGLAVAPKSFGRFRDDLLIGNFGDGKINVYEPDPSGGFEHVGALRNRNGNDIAIDGLWALAFGNGSAAGPRSSLFFTAGPDGEAHGLFGSIQVVDP